MTMRTNCILLLVILLGAFPLNRVHADESGSIILYTPYTKISVTPGASIDYSIDLINNTEGLQMQISRSADCRAVGSMKSSQAAGPSASFLYCPRKRKRSI